MKIVLVLVLLAFFSSVLAAPASSVSASGVVAGSTGSESDIPKIITLDDHGNVGVNFLGFRASAGLGGLLSGNLAEGGLHAEAGTPFGQAAGAGLGGTVDNDARAGGLYAGATAGGGTAAFAGTGGAVRGGSSFGASVAGATAGGQTKLAGTYSNGIHKETHVTKIATPIAEKQVELVEEVKPKTTIIERTVIPQYIEKTVRVPTYVEKTVKVATQPKIVEKTYETDNVEYTGDKVKVVEKTRIHHHPHHSKVKYRLHQRIAPQNVNAAAGFGASYGGGSSTGGNSAFSATYSKNYNGDFFSNIFNIPIATLGAVNKFLSNAAGGASGSLSVSKSYAASG